MFCEWTQAGLPASRNDWRMAWSSCCEATPRRVPSDKVPMTPTTPKSNNHDGVSEKKTENGKNISVQDQRTALASLSEQMVHHRHMTAYSDPFLRFSEHFEAPRATCRSAN